MKNTLCARDTAQVFAVLELMMWIIMLPLQYWRIFRLYLMICRKCVQPLHLFKQCLREHQELADRCSFRGCTSIVARKFHNVYFNLYYLTAVEFRVRTLFSVSYYLHLSTPRLTHNPILKWREVML